MTPEQISALLINPREDLHIEIKNWLDLKSSAEAKATFMKAVIALANHGGGFLIIGLTEKGHEFHESGERPEALEFYNQDLINGIVSSYADPAFHCSMHFVESPSRHIYPVVRVPGGHKVPIRAKRASPDGKLLENNCIYVRKPGPKSERPIEAREWEDLFARCFENRKDDVLNQLRLMISGTNNSTLAAESKADLRDWIDSCMSRWSALLQSSGSVGNASCDKGLIIFSYELVGSRKTLSLTQLPNVVRAAVIRHTGWPMFWYPSRNEIAPYPYQDAVECWIARGASMLNDERDASKSDFWRITTSGQAFLLRGFQEDDSGQVLPDGSEIRAGTLFDFVLPIWRAAELMLHAESMARGLIEGPASVNFHIEYRGLKGRQLVDRTGRRILTPGRISHQDTIHLALKSDIEAIGPRLPELVQELLKPLYSLFSFMELPSQAVVEEIKRMRATNF